MDWRKLREESLREGKKLAEEYMAFIAEASWPQANDCLVIYNSRRQNILQQDEWFAQGFTNALVEGNVRSPEWVFQPWYEKVDVRQPGILHSIP